MAITGKDAAYKTPAFINDVDLLPRDNSGGLEQNDYTQQFADGGYTLGGGVRNSGGVSGNTGGGSHVAPTDRKNGASDRQRETNK